MSLSSLLKKRRKKEFNDNLDQIRYVNGHKGIWRVDTNVTTALDIITQEANVKCVKLPFCGHPMNEQSLYEYVFHQFKNKERVIQCPHSKCQQVFAYPIIKNILQSMQSMPKHHQAEQVCVKEKKKKKKDDEKDSCFNSIDSMLFDIKQLI